MQMPKRMSHRSIAGCIVVGLLALLWCAAPAVSRVWPESEFENRPILDYPMPAGKDSVVGSFTNYTIDKGDTLLDIGRWYGLSGTEISDANGHIDWWAPPAGREIILPTEHILPEGPRTGIVMNIPEMRIYYYYPSPVVGRRRGKLTSALYRGSGARVIYTFPVGLGRFDWKTPVGNWTVTGKLVNPTWNVPQDIYEEHLERDGEAEHVIPGGEADNPLGHYKLVLSLPEYGIHGTDVPWGVGMNVSHGCIRLYPEDIERLFARVPVGTPGRFVYQPIKFGWRGNALYVEVHDDLYGVYPGLWNHAVHEVQRLNLGSFVDMGKLQKAVEAKSGLVTYVMPGNEPSSTGGLEAASLPAPPGVTTTAPSADVEPATTAPIVTEPTDDVEPATAPPAGSELKDEAIPATTTTTTTTSTVIKDDVEPPASAPDYDAPAADDRDSISVSAPSTAPAEAAPPDADSEPLPASHITSGDSTNQ
jgi:L,D-transpeptidase ErfK/SrfK